jgi:hypothetical protein
MERKEKCSLFHRDQFGLKAMKSRILQNCAAVYGHGGLNWLTPSTDQDLISFLLLAVDSRRVSLGGNQNSQNEYPVSAGI